MKNQWLIQVYVLNGHQAQDDQSSTLLIVLVHWIGFSSSLCTSPLKILPVTS
jgi:hypothetical protein